MRSAPGFGGKPDSLTAGQPPQRETNGSGIVGHQSTGQSTQYYQLVPVTGWEIFTTFDSPHCRQEKKPPREFPAAVTACNNRLSTRARTWRLLPVPAYETLAGESEVMLGDA